MKIFDCFYVLSIPIQTPDLQDSIQISSSQPASVEVMKKQAAVTIDTISVKINTIAPTFIIVIFSLQNI